LELSVHNEIFNILSGLFYSKIRHGKIWYLIDWEGYGPEKHTWELLENVHTSALLKVFLKNTLRNLVWHCPKDTPREGNTFMTPQVSNLSSQGSPLSNASLLSPSDSLPNSWGRSLWSLDKVGEVISFIGSISVGGREKILANTELFFRSGEGKY
uniref:Chromo domain-containing protein n=1 Tax=Chelonoidis abingdonii TaxID=106734 RepID=A0A8C0HBZ6_CHEAB